MVLRVTLLREVLLGNYHAAIICSKAEEETAQKIVGDIQRKAVELEGTITGEHGVGLELRDMLVQEAGDDGIAMMRTVCRILRGLVTIIGKTDHDGTDQKRLGSLLYTQPRQNIPIRVTDEVQSRSTMGPFWVLESMKLHSWIEDPVEWDCRLPGQSAVRLTCPSLVILLACNIPSARRLRFHPTLPSLKSLIVACRLHPYYHCRAPNGRVSVKIARRGARIGSKPFRMGPTPTHFGQYGKTMKTLIQQSRKLSGLPTSTLDHASPWGLEELDQVYPTGRSPICPRSPGITASSSTQSSTIQSNMCRETGLDNKRIPSQELLHCFGHS